MDTETFKNVEEITVYLEKTGNCDELIKHIKRIAQRKQTRNISLKSMEVPPLHRSRRFFETGEHDGLGPKNLPKPKKIDVKVKLKSRSYVKKDTLHVASLNVPQSIDWLDMVWPVQTFTVLRAVTTAALKISNKNVKAAVVKVKPTSKFESSEHEQTSTYSSMLQLPNGDTLGYGEIIALAGDFYGIPNKPICGKDDTLFDGAMKTRFMEAYITLAYDHSQEHKDELKQLLTMMKIEKNSVLTVLGKGDSSIPTILDADKTYTDPSDVYKEHGMWFTEVYDTILGGKWINGTPVIFGRMMQLAVDNPDHFHPYAPYVYRVGHEIAIEKAEGGGKLYEEGKAEGNEDKMNTALKILDEAYSIDAFACHFLTDGFASGHMRVPRNELPSSMKLSKNVGNYLVHFQHDEDGKFGVNVRNNNGDQWTSYGDGRLFDSESEKNLKQVRNAVDMSVHSVWDAFCNPTYVNNSSTFAVDNVIPEVDNNKPNNYPLFSVKNGKVWRRSDVNDLSDSNTIDNWWGWSTVILLRNYEPKNSRI